MDRTFNHNRHGWVIPNESGDVAKCGGPVECQSCRKDAEAMFSRHKEVFIDIIRKSPEYQDSLMNHKSLVMDATNRRNDALCKAALRFTLDHFTGVILNPNQLTELADVEYDSWYIVMKDNGGRLTITATKSNGLEHGTVIKVPTLG